MKQFRILVKTQTTVNLFGVGNVTLVPNKVVTSDEIPEIILDAIQSMTPVKLYEEVKYSEDKVVTEDNVNEEDDLLSDDELDVTPPTLKEIDEADTKPKEPEYKDMDIDTLRLECDNRGIEHSKSNNATHLIKKLEDYDGKH